MTPAASLCKRLRVASRNGTGLALSSRDVDILRVAGILRRIFEIEIAEIEGEVACSGISWADTGSINDVTPANGPSAGTSPPPPRMDPALASRGGVALAFEAIGSLKDRQPRR